MFFVFLSFLHCIFFAKSFLSAKRASSQTVMFILTRTRIQTRIQTHKQTQLHIHTQNVALARRVNEVMTKQHNDHAKQTEMYELVKKDGASVKRKRVSKENEPFKNIESPCHIGRHQLLTFCHYDALEILYGYAHAE